MRLHVCFSPSHSRRFLIRSFTSTISQSFFIFNISLKSFDIWNEWVKSTDRQIEFVVITPIIFLFLQRISFVDEDLRLNALSNVCSCFFPFIVTNIFFSSNWFHTFRWHRFFSFFRSTSSNCCACISNDKGEVAFDVKGLLLVWLETCNMGLLSCLSLSSSISQHC